MEILFKDDNRIYYIRNNYLHSGSTERFLDKDLTNIPHLDDAEVLYHYRNIDTMLMRPVYYEHDGKFITSDVHMYSIRYSAYYYKDYTLVNLKIV